MKPLSLPSFLRTILAAFVLCATVAIIVYLCAFKIIDNDFFWHVKAGELMWKTKSLIHIEPFSYVLADKPYGALHEWLAQIIFYLVFHLGGVTAAILLRGALASLTALCLIAIDRRSMLPFALLAIVALYLQRPSLMVRPQLFTLLFLCLSLLLLFQYIRRGEQPSSSDSFSDDSEKEGPAFLLNSGLLSLDNRRGNSASIIPWIPLSGTPERGGHQAGVRADEGKNKEFFSSEHCIFFASILLIQILWVNLHGASAIFGVVCILGFFLQSCLEWYGSSDEHRPAFLLELRFRAILLGTVSLALLASPNGIKTFVDMYAHRFDATIPLIREWMPLVWHDYATDVLPFGLLALSAIIAQRRAWVLCITVWAFTGFLSLQSYRHCILFVLASLAILFFQLGASARWRKYNDALWRYPAFTLFGGLIVFGMVFAAMYHHDGEVLRRTNHFGFGIGIPVEGAADFVERENIRGVQFNTYNQGGYLLFRGYPKRKVFADGRNIEYGISFVQKLSDASTNPVRWKELNDRYGFTYAIVEYKATPGQGDLLPYITFLEADPSWVLVYLDDWATVYVKNSPQYASLIKKYAYAVLSPAALEFSDTLDALPAKQWPEAEAELRRVIEGSPLSIKPRLLLADRLLAGGHLDEAKKIALDALAAQPYRPEVFELLGRISVENLDWSKAGRYFEQAVEYSSGQGPGINYDYLAEIFSKSGEADKADYYYRKAVKAGRPPRTIQK